MIKSNSMVYLHTTKLDSLDDDGEEIQDMETPFHPGTMDNHRFSITDDPDGDNVDMYLKEDSVGALFLRLLIQQNRQRVKEVAKKAPFHLAGPDKICIDRALEAMDTDPVAGDNPDQLVGIAQILFNNKQYDEARALLTFDDPDNPYLPKWPNHLKAALILVRIAETNRDFETIVELLTDQNGEARFQRHQDLLRILTHGLNRTQRFQQTIAIVQKAEKDMGEATVENPAVLQNYLYALYHTGNSQTAAEKFTTHEGINLPCRPTVEILINLGLTLNACKEYRKTYYFMRDLLHYPVFYNSPKFLSVITKAANELGLYEITIELLTENNGEYRFPQNIDCLRNLGYAYVFTTRLKDAQQLVNFVRSQGFELSLIYGVISSLQNAERTPQERQLANVRQSFVPKRSQSAALFPEE